LFDLTPEQVLAVKFLSYEISDTQLGYDLVKEEVINHRNWLQYLNFHVKIKNSHFRISNTELT